MSPLISLYPACYTGDIQAINARSSDVHINLHYSTGTKSAVDGGAGKMVKDNHATTTQIYL